MKGFFNMKILLAVGISLFIVTSCKDEFLDFTPAGVVSDADLNTVKKKGMCYVYLFCCFFFLIAMNAELPGRMPQMRNPAQRIPASGNADS